VNRLQGTLFAVVLHVLKGVFPLVAVLVVVADPAFQ